MDSLVKVCERHFQVKFLFAENTSPQAETIISLLDINECEVDLHNCDQQATCTNNPGSYSCACNTGWTGDGFTCGGINVRLYF